MIIGKRAALLTPPKRVKAATILSINKHGNRAKKPVEKS